MSDGTQIQWTDASWNPTTGCTKVSPGCAHCYIAGTPPFRMAGRKFDEKGHIPLILHENRLTTPLSWSKARRVFVNSLSDLFHDDIPDEYIDRVFAVMALTPQHTYQVLTKRPGRMREYMVAKKGRDLNTIIRDKAWDLACRLPKAQLKLVRAHVMVQPYPWPLPNVWLGCTVENQRFADERIPILLDTPAAVRFLSCEPLLSQLNLEEYLNGRNEVSRRGGLSGGDDGRTDNRFGGPYLASRSTTRQQVDGWNDDDPVRTAAGRESDRLRLPSSESDDRLLAHARLGPPAGLEALPRADPVGADHQPQERQSIGQPAGEPRTGDSVRAGASQDPGVGVETRTQLSWVIVGGESGPNARPTDIAHIRSIVGQCKTAGVPVFCKQTGASNRCPHDRKGGHMECWPTDLMIREFPNGA